MNFDKKIDLNYHIVQLNPSATNYKEQVEQLYKNPPKTHEQHLKELDYCLEILKLRAKNNSKSKIADILSNELANILSNELNDSYMPNYPIYSSQESVNVIYKKCTYCASEFVLNSPKKLCDACREQIHKNLNYRHI